MLHTKFRGNRSTVPEKKIFKGFFTIHWRGGHLGHVTQIPRTNFVPPTQGGST